MNFVIIFRFGASVSHRHYRIKTFSAARLCESRNTSNESCRRKLTRFNCIITLCIHAALTVTPSSRSRSRIDDVTRTGCYLRIKQTNVNGCCRKRHLIYQNISYYTFAMYMSFNRDISAVDTDSQHKHTRTHTYTTGESASLCDRRSLFPRKDFNRPCVYYSRMSRELKNTQARSPRPDRRSIRALVNGRASL